MSTSTAKTRLYVDRPLGTAQDVTLGPGQSHYIYSVLRMREGDTVGLFNGRDGEWSARVRAATKRAVLLRCAGQARPQSKPPDIWLMFSPLKKSRTNFVVEKATELGVARILPVRMDFTSASRVSRSRLNAVAAEASEQCGGDYVPPVDGLAPLDERMRGWPSGRRLIYCDEGLAGETPFPLLEQNAGGCGLLIGPEGGISARERTMLARSRFAEGADTAAVAALALIHQSILGNSEGQIA